MSGDTRHPVDLDTLADYTAGVLDGAEAARVADLIETDTGWARAYEALVRAEAAVRDDLRAAAAMSDHMPDDVAARIDAALTSLPERGAVVSLDAARARRRRIATAVAGVAAAGVAVLGGLSLANTQMSAGMEAADAPVLAPEAAEPPVAPHGESDGVGSGDMGSVTGDSSAWPLVIASGRDYTTGSVRDLWAYAGAAPPADADKTSRPDMAMGEAPRAAAGGALARLAAPAALEACLAAINAIQPGQPVVVDFARYEGAPALVTLVRQTASSIVVVVGPDCGISDADMITAVPA
ncbi:MAG TPA: hypothetical protein VK028_16765 [Micromonosporaceae bacterium]|nr:hypothetical protein [Micromonosporaceae bacterium]